MAGARSAAEQRYEIIAGERRWRAAQLAGLSDIPAVIREVPDEAAVAMALIENIQREDLNPLEEARAFERLIAEFGLTHQQAADAVGRSRAAVTNLLRLLELAPEVARAGRAARAGHGPRPRAAWARKSSKTDRTGAIGREKGPVCARNRGPGSTPEPARQPARQRADGAGLAGRDPNVERLESELADKLGAQVQIQHTRRAAGKLVVAYNSLDELDGILSHIQ